MQRVTLLFLYLIITTCSSSGSEVANEYALEFESVDVFGANKIDASRLNQGPGIRQINELLVDKTDSIDLDENLDIVLEQLILDYKNGVEKASQHIKAKRILLALRTLKGGNECGYYSRIIMYQNFAAIGTSMKIIRDSTTNTITMRRVDKLLVNYARKHYDDCKSIYFENFDKISTSLTPEKVSRVDRFLKKVIGSLTSSDEHSKNPNTYLDKLYKAASDRISSSIGITPIYIYDFLWELDNEINNPESSFLESGATQIRRDKFDKLYDDYIVEPCHYFRQQLGPSVFEPLQFDNIFSHQIDYDRPKFYEAWLKFGLCYSEFQLDRYPVVELANEIELAKLRKMPNL